MTEVSVTAPSIKSSPKKLFDRLFDNTDWKENMIGLSKTELMNIANKYLESSKSSFKWMTFNLVPLLGSAFLVYATKGNPAAIGALTGFIGAGAGMYMHGAHKLGVADNVEKFAEKLEK